MFKIRYIAYKTDTLEIVEAVRVFTSRFARAVHETPGVECMDVTWWPDRELLARINAANGTDHGAYYTVKGNDGKSYDICVEALNSAVGELHACLKVCHRIHIGDSEVLRGCSHAPFSA